MKHREESERKREKARADIAAHGFLGRLRKALPFLR